MKFTLRLFSVLVFAILLIGVFSPFIGTIELLHHQSKMQNIKPKTYTTIELSKIAFSQQRISNKEILIDGKYFDMHSIQSFQDSIIITGEFDYHESKIRDKISKNLHNNSKQSNSIVFFSFYYVQNIIESNPLLECDDSFKHLSKYLCPTSNAFVNLDEHPPC